MTRCGASSSRWRRMIDVFELDTSSVALDMTNFATYIDTTNDKAPIAQRGKAKQKRTDLRLVGLGMVVTRAGGIPLVWHAYPGNRPDVTQFPHLIDHPGRPARHPGRRCPWWRRRRERGDGHDGGLRRRAELHRELRPTAPVRAAVRGIRARPATAPTCSRCPPPAARSSTTSASPG